MAVAILSSKGAAGVTGSGFIVLAATLSVVPSVPVAGMALILGVDRFMSECRALTNFVGNAVATIVVARWEGAVDPGQLARRLPRRGRRASPKRKATRCRSRARERRSDGLAELRGRHPRLAAAGCSCGLRQQRSAASICAALGRRALEHIFDDQRARLLLGIVIDIRLGRGLGVADQQPVIGPQVRGA